MSPSFSIPEGRHDKQLNVIRGILLADKIERLATLADVGLDEDTIEHVYEVIKARALRDRGLRSIVDSTVSAGGDFNDQIAEVAAERSTRSLVHP